MPISKDNEIKFKLLESIKLAAISLCEHYAGNIQLTINVNSNMNNAKIDIKECNL